MKTLTELYSKIDNLLNKMYEKGLLVEFNWFHGLKAEDKEGNKIIIGLEVSE